MSTPVLVTLIITAGLVLIFTIAFIGSLIDKKSSDTDKAAVWDEAYKQGVWDEITSREWTNGETPPARRNPYAKEQNNNGK